ARDHAALAAAAVLRDARLRGDVAARLLGARRAGLRPAVQALREPLVDDGRDDRLSADDRRDARAGRVAHQVLARLAARAAGAGPQAGPGAWRREFALGAPSSITLEVVMPRFFRR